MVLVMKSHLIHKMPHKIHKKGNFAIVFSFLFGLVLLVSLFFGTFFSYQYQINSQMESLEKSEGQNPYAQAFTSYNISSPYEFMGRTYYRIENTGNNPLIYGTRDNELCFDIFSQNEFFDSSKAKITPQKALVNTYREIGTRKTGNLILQSENMKDKDISFSSCNGISQKNTFDESLYFWWNDEWNMRTELSVGDLGEKYDYGVTRLLEETQINFSEFRENDLKVAMPLKEYSIYEFSMDSLSQTQIEPSQQSQEISLGSTSSSDINDPTLERGVLFNGYTFNGSQYASTSTFEGINGSEQATISFWMKDSTLLGDEQLLYNSEVINLTTSPLNGENLLLTWKFNESWGTEHEFSNVLKENTFQFISITFNNSQTCLYVDTVEHSCVVDTPQTLSDNLSTLYVGGTEDENGFSGILDEFSFFSLALTSNEISSLYTGSQLFRELTFDTNSLSVDNEEVNITIQFPKLLSQRNVSAYIYYDR